MLGKLLKYNLKDNYKNLYIFYSLGLFSAILTRLFLSIENSFIMSIIASILSGVTISMIANIIINNLIRVWVRFRQNLYGDESYLTHTLPVGKSTLYLSKILGSVVTLFTSVLVIAVMLFIAYYSKENILVFKKLLLPFAKAYNSTILGIISAFLIILFLELLNGLQSGFSGIILSNGKIGFSVLYGLIAYISTQVFVLLITYIFALFNPKIMNLFNTLETLDVATVKFLIFIALVAYSLSILILYFINVKLFKKGVNVD